VDIEVIDLAGRDLEPLVVGILAALYKGGPFPAIDRVGADPGKARVVVFVIAADGLGTAIAHQATKIFSGSLVKGPKNGKIPFRGQGCPRGHGQGLDIKTDLPRGPGPE